MASVIVALRCYYTALEAALFPYLNIPGTHCTQIAMHESRIEFVCRLELREEKAGRVKSELQNTCWCKQIPEIVGDRMSG